MVILQNFIIIPNDSRRGSPIKSTLSYFRSPPCRKARNSSIDAHSAHMSPSVRVRSVSHRLTPRGGLHSLARTLGVPPYIASICSLNPSSPPTPFSLSKNLKQSTAAFMSSTGQATSSTQADNVQLIIAALADYTKETGINLSNNPFAAKLEQSNSPEAILQLLQGRENAFKQYRDDSQGLINCLNPAVKVLHGFSGILSEVAGQVGRSGHLVNHLT
jgi:hypothetical protein